MLCSSSECDAQAVLAVLAPKMTFVGMSECIEVGRWLSLLLKALT